MSPTTPRPGTESTLSDAWMPTEAGETLEGTLVDIDVAWSKFRAAKNPEDPNAGWYPLLTVAPDGKPDVKVHCFRTVLYNEVMRKQPVSGERVTITFVGVGEAKDGMSGAHIYRVKVHGRGANANAYAGMRPPTGPSGAAPANGSDVPNSVAGEDDLPF